MFPYGREFLPEERIFWPPSSSKSTQKRLKLDNNFIKGTIYEKHFIGILYTFVI